MLTPVFKNVTDRCVWLSMDVPGTVRRRSRLSVFTWWCSSISQTGSTARILYTGSWDSLLVSGMLLSVGIILITSLELVTMSPPYLTSHLAVASLVGRLVSWDCASLAKYTGQQNSTFFWAHEEKYLILIELLTLNSNV